MTHRPDDPLLWLEDVTGARAARWVRDRNACTERELGNLPGFARMRHEVRTILDSAGRIPAVNRVGNWLYNLWRDERNPRGLWRRTTLKEFAKPQPQWQNVLDLDQLASAEGENWVWAGAIWCGPRYRRVMLALSRGGADARVLREFDVVDGLFVEGGFELAEGKSSLAWISDDELWLMPEFGPDSLTASGYPRTIRRWSRGVHPHQSTVVFTVAKDDLGCGVSIDRTVTPPRVTFERTIDFYRSRSYLLSGDQLVAIERPDDATSSFWRDHLLLSLRSPWRVEGQIWPAGSLLSAPAHALASGRLPPSMGLSALFTPSTRRHLESYSFTRDSVVLELLDNVNSVLETRTPPAPDADAGSPWTERRLSAPLAGSLAVQALHDPQLLDDPLAEALIVQGADFLIPDSLMFVDVRANDWTTLKSRPSFFDASGVRVEQREAHSADGTTVPYFVVMPGGAEGVNPRPTLLYGYGGFELSMRPSYSANIGTQWLDKGGVYALANIRGGGEFGPAWHQAAVGANRQRAFDDFAAIAEDLIARGITTSGQLGIQGGSNGGLLVAAVMLQRPELFKAVVCQVPLLDMRRYHLLLAGASWMAEYGNPDDDDDWAFISRYSPYQVLGGPPPAGPALPRVLFVTSTRDDRVHPGHARKMAERMRQLGHDVLYWENTEGGHGAAADNRQAAQLAALQFAFLWRELAGAVPAA